MLLTLCLAASPQLLAPALPPSSARTTSACDDFDRASGSNMGPDWSEVAGDFQIMGNAGTHTGGGADGYMIHSQLVVGVTGSDMRLDFGPDFNGRSRQYVALILGYHDPLNAVFVRIADSDSDGLYDEVAFLQGINGAPWNSSSGVQTLATPISSGTAHVYFTASGDVANCDVASPLSGQIEHFESNGLLGQMQFGLQFGVGAFGSPTFDDFEVNDGCSSPPTLSVSNLVAGGVASVDVSSATPNGLVGVAYSLAGPGPSTANAGPCGAVTLELSVPIRVLPLLTANAAGAASTNAPIPGGTTGVAVWLHALDLSSCTLTNALAEIIG